MEAGPRNIVDVILLNKKIFSQGAEQFGKLLTTLRLTSVK